MADAAIKKFKGSSGKALIEAIFQADAPDQFIRTLPSQSLYLALQQTGLENSSELILLGAHEQVRTLLDFDLWHKDEFNEERLWNWLSLGDDEDGLRVLQKVLSCIDLKLIALLIATHVETVSPLEPTEAPPSPGYFTPDKGNTWLLIKLEDPDKHFYLGRLLAMIFETNAEMFYQLLASSGVATNSMLEEEAFQEKQKRLSAEGIPSIEDAAEVNTPISEASLSPLIEDKRTLFSLPNVHAVTPLIHDRITPQPLSLALAGHSRKEDLELELTYIMNACFVYFHLDLSEADEISLYADKVKGAINIGLEMGSAHFNLPPEECLQALGLRNLYRLGLKRLFELRAGAAAALKSKKTAEGPGELLLHYAANRFPEVPEFAITDTKDLDAAKLATTRVALLSLSEVKKVEQLLANLE